MRELLSTLVRGLVEQPESVSVEEHHEGNEVLFDVTVAPEDRGFVIGRRGRTVDALRTILDAVARRQGATCEIEVRD